MRRDRAHRATALLLAMLLLPSSVTTGCSLMLVDGPRPDDTRLGGQAPCTTSHAWPIFDMVLSGWFLVNAVLNANKPASSFGANGEGESTKAGAVALGVMLVGLTGISSGVGFSRVNACEASLADPAWQPTPLPRRRSVPRPPPASAPPPGSPPPGGLGPPDLGQPAPSGGTGTPVPGAGPPASPKPGQPAVPAVPATPPSPQIDDDEAPRPRAPRSGFTLPATGPLLAAMPRLSAHSDEPVRPTFEGLSRFVHPWALVTPRWQ